MIITIDGPSGTGKSTISQAIAKKLHIMFFSSGALYRCLAWLAIEKNINPSNEEEVNSLLKDFSFRLNKDKNRLGYFVNGREVTDHISSTKISERSSVLAANEKVRKFLIPIQRKIAASRDLIVEGRDMGTTVFPNAEIKIYLTASLKVRAQRRWKELRGKGQHITYEEVEEQLQARDFRDESRKYSPLCCPKDAMVIDSSHKAFFQVVHEILQIVRSYKRLMHTSFLFRTVCFLSFIFMRFFYRLEVFGRENLINTGAILAANHVSFYDPPVVTGASREEIFFLAREGLFRPIFFGSLIAKLNALPIAKKAADKKTFKSALLALSKGKKVLLFPEGTRSFNGKIQPILPGIGFLTYLAQCPIIPIYIDGTFSIWPRKQLLPKPWGKIRCIFGKPIHINCEDRTRKEVIREVQEKVYDSLLQLEKWSQNGYKGDTP